MTLSPTPAGYISFLDAIAMILDRFYHKEIKSIRKLFKNQIISSTGDSGSVYPYGFIELSLCDPRGIISYQFTAIELIPAFRSICADSCFKFQEFLINYKVVCEFDGIFDRKVYYSDFSDHLFISSYKFHEFFISNKSVAVNYRLPRYILHQFLNVDSKSDPTGPAPHNTAKSFTKSGRPPTQFNETVSRMRALPNDQFEPLLRAPQKQIAAEFGVSRTVAIRARNLVAGERKQD